MQDGLAKNVVIIARGELHPLSGAEVLQTLAGILAGTDYTVYDDLIRPVMRVRRVIPSASSTIACSPNP